MKRKQLFLVLGIGLIVIGLTVVVVCVGYKANKGADPSNITQGTGVPTSVTPTAVPTAVPIAGVEDIFENGEKADPEHSHSHDVTPPPVKLFEGKKETLGVLTNDAYAAYDNKILSGAQVTEAFTLFRGKRVAILVATQMVMDGTIALNMLDGNVSTDTPTVGASGLTGICDSAGNDMSEKLTFINYGAVLKGSKGKATITFETDHFLSQDGLDMDGDMCVTNPVTDNIVKAGSSENIADYLYMQSYLVKDSNGMVIGLAFYAVK